MEMGEDVYDVPLQQGKVFENAERFTPPCRTTLLAKENSTQYLYQWNPTKNAFDKTRELKTESAHKKAGNIVWWSDEGKDKKGSSKHISFIGPVNRHCYYKQESVLQNKVFSCGKEIEPPPPGKVIGACKRRSEQLKISYSPYIAIRESEKVIAFYWLISNKDSQKKSWVKKGVITLPDKHYVAHTVFFSQDGTQAVTYALEEKEFKFNIALQIRGSIGFIPQRLLITLDDEGNVGYTMSASTTMTITALEPDSYWNLSVDFDGDIASEFVDNELKHLHIRQENVIGVYQPPFGQGIYVYFGYPSMALDCTVWSTPFNNEGYNAMLNPPVHWSDFPQFAGGRPPPDATHRTISAPRVVGLSGRIGIAKQTIQEMDEQITFNIVSLTGYAQVEGTGPLELITFWDNVGCSWSPTVDMGYFSDKFPLANLNGAIKTRKLYANFATSFLVFVEFDFGAYEKPAYEVNTMLYKISDGIGYWALQEDSGYYRISTDDPQFNTLEMDAKGLNGSASDHGYINKSMNNERTKNERMTIAVCDLQSDLMILTGKNKLQLTRISNGQMIQEFPIQHLAYGQHNISQAFSVIDGTLLKQRFVAFEGNVEYYSMQNQEGVWSSLSGLSYASDKFGNYLLKYNDIKVLKESNEQKNWTEIGVI